MFASLEVSIWPHETPSLMQFSQIPHIQTQILIFVQSCNPINLQSSHTLENPKHNSSLKSVKLTSRIPRCILPRQHIPSPFQIQNWLHPPQILPSHSPDLFLFPRFHLSPFQSWPILFQPLSLKFANSALLLKVNNVSLIPSQLSFWNSASLNSIQSSQILPVSFWRNFPIVIQTSFVQPLLKKPSLSTDDLNNYRSISNLNFISNILEKVVAFRIQSHLSFICILCLLLNLLTRPFIPLKLLFSKFTVISSLRWIVMRSLHSYFSTYLLPLILSIIPSFSPVFKIGSVLVVFFLISSHLISHLALRQSQSMIPSLHSLLFHVVYVKVSYLAHSFSNLNGSVISKNSFKYQA